MVVVLFSMELGAFVQIWTTNLNNSYPRNVFEFYWSVVYIFTIKQCDRVQFSSTYMKAHLIQYSVTRNEYDRVGNLTNIDYSHLLVKVCVRSHINGELVWMHNETCFASILFNITNHETEFNNILCSRVFYLIKFLNHDNKINQLHILSANNNPWCS